MSDFEALMWNVEKDPGSTPTGMASVYDQPLDTGTPANGASIM